MEIQKTEKNGETYYNIDLRKIDYKQPETLTLASDKPYEVNGKFGISYMYRFVYNNMEVSSFVPEYFKSPTYDQPLCDVLKSYKIGDILQIAKKEGHTKGGKTYRFFEVTQIGIDENVIKKEIERREQYQNNQNGDQPSTPTFQQNTDVPNLNVEKGIELSSWENQVLDGIKNDSNLVNITSEQKITLFTQNNIEYNRAKEIVDNSF